MRPILELEELEFRRHRRLLRNLRFVTTPTSYFARLTGQEAFTDGILLGDGSMVGTSGNVVPIPAATTTLTLTPAAHGGRTMTIAPTGGLAITPPAATGTGIKYRFVCSAAISGGNFTFDAKAGNASDKIYGALLSWKSTPAYTNYAATGVVANTNLITLNGTTTGGSAVGDWFEILDASLNVWVVTNGFLIQSGSVATPFSNH